MSVSVFIRGTKVSARKRNWGRLRPVSLAHAFELCGDHASEVLRRPAKVMADLMATPLSTYYRWISECEMPVNRIRQFETLSGVTFVSDWLALADGSRMVVAMPTGRGASAEDVAELQRVTADATALLVNCYARRADLETTREAMDLVLVGWAFHRANVMKLAAPELDFGGESINP